MTDNKLSTLRKIAYALLAVLLILILLEFLLRVGSTVYDDFARSDQWYAHSPTLGWRPRPGFRGLIPVHGYRAFDEEGNLTYDSKQIADKDTKKIVVLGDSTAMGFGVKTPQTFAERLDKMLPERSVINLGVNGYSSLQTLLTLQLAVKELRPSTVIVSCGYNDRRYVLDETHVDSKSRYRDIGEQSPSWYESLHLIRSARKLIGSNHSDPRPIAVDKLYVRVGKEAYRENLLKMVETAKENDVRIIFLATHDNPTKTLDLREGIARLEAGDHGEAIRLLQRAVDAENSFSDIARMHLAKALRAKDLPDEADAASKIPSPSNSVFGGHTLVLDREYCEIIRQVAKETGSEYIDVGKELDETPGVYFDFCHFDEIGHRIVTELLYERIVD